MESFNIYIYIQIFPIYMPFKNIFHFIFDLFLYLIEEVINFLL